MPRFGSTTTRQGTIDDHDELQILEVKELLEAANSSVSEGGGVLDVKTGVQSVHETVKVLWEKVTYLLLAFLCINLLLSLKRLLRQAGGLKRFLVYCWVSLLRDLVGLMPFHPQGNLPGIGVESLRRRVSSLERLLRTSVERNRVQRGAEPAVGIPVANVSRWELLGSFVAGLWCGCIVSLLALCIGVHIGHSL